MPGELHPGRSGHKRSTVMAYVSLTKPRVMELLLVTTAPVMFLAEGGLPPLWLLVATLVGGAMAAGSAGALNCYYDRDIDAVMHRTENRPLVTGEVSPRGALIFALVLGIGSIVWLGGFTNWVAAGLTAIAIGFYAVIYTMILKRRTRQNIVWGGAAGCMPVLIGWSAVTGGLSWEPVLLFLVIFFWTPPHYWPLAIKYRADYEAAEVPMLPVVAPSRTVSRQVLLYAWAMVASSLVLVPVGHMDVVYTATAVAVGAWFLIQCHQLQRQVGTQGFEERISGPAMKLFHGSITYLSILFVAIAVDPFVHLWS
ncbi:heme o synthase [Spelaeicoccus albus]|uniref:heme o synthase n=1 Tax=Spelaeicoccus albus TaxID=1280376 RepID=UPI0022AB3782|nr:heme o synthase [Spelaeicoccus albus]